MSSLDSPFHEPRRSSRWAKLVGGGVLCAALGVVGFEISASAQQAGEEDKEDAIRKALDALKKGPEPVKEDKPVDLNPVDEMRRAEEAIRKARKQLQEDPKNEQARKVVEDATKKLQEGLKLRNPNLAMPIFPMLPVAPQNFEELDKELQKVMDEYQRQLQLLQGNRAQMFQGLQANRMMMLRGGVGGGTYRLGIRTERVSPVLSEQLDLPPDVGLIVGVVLPDSPAEKAGIKANDVLIELGGKAVPNDVMELQRMLREIKNDETVDLVLMRKGKKETLKGIALPAARPDGFNQPFAPAIPNLRIGGAFPQIEFGNGGKVSAMSISMNGPEFTIRMTEDGVKYTVVGIKDEVGPKATLIEIDDNGVTSRTDTLEKLEGPQQEVVQKLLKRIR